MPKHPDKNIRGIRDTIPPGYVLGRLGLSAGPARLISIKELADALVKGGFLGVLGSPTGPPPPPEVWFTGNGVPNDALGADTNYYLDLTGGIIYQRASGAWGGSGGVAALTGPVTWFSGNGPPANTLGANNDLYLDLTAQVAYEKLAGSWT
jgi:hypothetical protein